MVQAASQGLKTTKAAATEPSLEDMAQAAAAVVPFVQASRHENLSRGKMANGWISVDHFAQEVICGRAGPLPAPQGLKAMAVAYHKPLLERSCIVCAGRANMPYWENCRRDATKVMLAVKGVEQGGVCGGGGAEGT